mgnify:CR=1 FL=1
MGRKSVYGTIGGRALAAALLATPALPAIVAGTSTRAIAQTGAQTNYNIAAGPLGHVLAAFGSQSGTQVSYDAAIAAGITSPGIRGAATREQAVAQILRGSGLSYSFTDPTSVLISDPAAPAASADGSLVLDPIDVTAGSNPTYAPYETAAPTVYISGEEIERFRGSSPADMFRGTPGVMSGEARNSGSSVDVNIRGMQGMGRVAVTVDGAMNSTNVYQGYQGISNRTFVDPDFIAGVDITKGSSAASNGIAGSVSMRTLEASDIVKDGNTYGLRVKGSAGGNTSEPVPGALAGFDITNFINGYPSVTESADGMVQPNFLEPTQGSGSAVGAVETENFDLLAGYAYRKRGNYHAGSNGPSAEVEYIGLQPFCYPDGSCPFDYLDYAINSGLANYRAGEEVLNTQLETKSFLAKGTARFPGDQSLQLGYMRFESEAGDRLASRFNTETSQAEQQEQTAGAKLDTVTLKYRLDPVGNDLVDLSANAWHTNVAFRNPRRAGTMWSPNQPEDFGLPDDFRVGTDNVMWGADVSNTSLVDTRFGEVSATYGASYLREDTRPSPYTLELENWLGVRDGMRQEAAGFVTAEWAPTGWLTLNGGLRYQHFWSKDRSEPDPADNTGESHGQTLSQGGLSPHVGITLEPLDGLEFYAKYSNAERAPSIMESLTGYSTKFNPDLQPERSRNWEIGANLVRDGVFTADDLGMIKVGYFNWDVSNYLARQWKTDFVAPSGYTYSSMYVFNIARAKFEGLEFSGRYETGGFAAELSANYYLNVEFCPTSATCIDKTLYADYTTNMIPPQYQISLTASQKLLEDRLTVGGRVTHVGARPIGHGEETASGLSSFIDLIEWDPYTLVDVFAEYKFNDHLTGAFRIENLTDQYYVDPLSLVQQPSPGRTFYASLTASF